MASYNPYFRYETDGINMRTGQRAPVFPVQAGLSLHTYPTEKMSHTTTSRMHGTTEFTYRVENMMRDDRDDFQGFWSTILNNGLYDFSIIDNRNRVLFEASWNNWRQRWQKRNGGLYTVDIDIQSAVPWTPPMHGAYLMTIDEGESDFTRQNEEFTLDLGTLKEDSDDSNIIRQNGYALRMTDNTSAVPKLGATLNVDWKSSYNKPVSMFCQYRTGRTTTDDFVIMEMNANSHNIKLIQNGDDPAYIAGQVDGINVTRSAVANLAVSELTWYDVAYTFDAVNENNYVYVIATDTGSSFTDFLSNTSGYTTQIGTYMAAERSPLWSKWTSINLLLESVTNALTDINNYVYLQNAMFLDGFLTTFDFNTLRRLCYMWNNKTEVYPK